MSESTKNMNTRARLLHAATGLWLFGGPAPKLAGTPMQVATAASVAIATKKFKEELDRPEATTRSVMDMLDAKHRAARQFERVFGTQWLL